MAQTHDSEAPSRRRPSLARVLMRSAYAANQFARVGWYAGQRLLAERSAIGEDEREQEAAQSPQTDEPSAPSARANLIAGIRDLFARDLANVEAGLYPMPRDTDGGLPRLIAQARAIFRDLPSANRRRKEKDGQEVYRKARETGEASSLPRYYLQNFHFQTDGYLSDHSAQLYDSQVESLFVGTANAMRRQALVPFARFLEGKDQRKVAMVDIACGTGRFLRMTREAFPRLNLTGIDLSEAYLREARKHLKRLHAVRLAMGNAEQIPLPDESQDIVTSIFLFHELPPKVRAIVAGEFARVLKPGGILVFVDSLQIGDTEGYDRILESFPGRFHEPYYDGYIREDLDKLYTQAGLTLVGHTPAFLSKVSVYTKPE
ncbi:MAG: class I SAM-dependent methyltransferase [Novosphingobium sp.]|nr:class I SAM-dependent methyltransferase [Novosphingobium sp.]